MTGIKVFGSLKLCSCLSDLTLNKGDKCRHESDWDFTDDFIERTCPHSSGVWLLVWLVASKNLFYIEFIMYSNI